jgi:hypothetical protein
MIELVFPLVGMRFRGYAQQILDNLPTGTPLTLEPEDNNAYDPKAVRILFDFSYFPLEMTDRLAEALTGTGHTVDDFINSGELVHLAYIPDSDGNVVRKLGCVGNRELRAAIAAAEVADWTSLDVQLGFTPDGQPAVVVNLPSADSSTEN